MPAAKTSKTPAFETVLYDEPRKGVARVTLNRPEKRNAQDMQMTYDLNGAFDFAVQQEHVKVIVLAATGQHFSSGHDLSGDGDKTWRDFPVVGTWANFDAPGAEGRYAREMEIYLEMTERWRNLSKPIVAQIQGKCVTGGLMLAWCSDMVIASDDAQFICTSTKMGGSGVEFWAYPWEIGPRRAKQWMLMGELSAAKALEYGMVNEVVPRAELEKFTLDFAERLTAHTSWTLSMTKLTVNQAQDLQGRRSSMLFSFAIHQLGHAHREKVHGALVDPNTLPDKIRAEFLKRQSREKARAGG
jgi:enoyl-CoA hydratase